MHFRAWRWVFPSFLFLFLSHPCICPVPLSFGELCRARYSRFPILFTGKKENIEIALDKFCMKFFGKNPAIDRFHFLYYIIHEMEFVLLGLVIFFISISLAEHPHPFWRTIGLWMFATCIALVLLVLGSAIMGFIFSKIYP